MDAAPARLLRYTEVGEFAIDEPESLDRKLLKVSTALPGNVVLVLIFPPDSKAREELVGDRTGSAKSFESIRAASHLSIDRIIIDISYKCILRGGCGVVDEERDPSGNEIRLTLPRLRPGLGEGLGWTGYRWDRVMTSGRGVSTFRAGGVLVERVSKLRETGG